MKVGIVVFPGTNCEEDTFRTLKYLGFDNFEFYNELEKMGFVVHKDFSSNYNKTIFSKRVLFFQG